MGGMHIYSTLRDGIRDNADLPHGDGAAPEPVLLASFTCSMCVFVQELGLTCCTLSYLFVRLLASRDSSS